MIHDDQIYSQLVQPIYEQETGRPLSGSEYDDLMKEPSWSLYFAGSDRNRPFPYAYSIRYGENADKK